MKILKMFWLKQIKIAILKLLKRFEFEEDHNL